MYSINFPNIFNPGKVTVSLLKDKEATENNLKLLLKSGKGELFGDPNFGTNLYSLIYNQSNAILRDIIIDTIYTNILVYMPQLAIKRNDIEILFDNTNIKIKIKCLNKQDYTLNNYELVLLANEVSQ